MKYKIIFLFCILIMCCSCQTYSVQTKTNPLEVYFSPNGGIQKRIEDILYSADKTIDIAIYSFSSDELVYPLIERANKGVKIRIIMDDLQASHDWCPDERLNKVDNIEVALDTSSQIMHNKYIIVDSKIVVTGSYNWSKAAESKNYENVIIFNDYVIANKFENNFNKLWKKWRKK